jgi:HK97 gp10 family phage protein
MAKLLGSAELKRKFDELGKLGQAKVLRQSMRAAMKPVLTEAIARAPVGTVPHRTFKGRLVAPGFAQRSIKLVVARSKRTGNYRAVIGVAREAFYAVQFPEFGNLSQGLPPKPWLSVAMRNNSDRVVELYADDMRKRILKIARKGKV